MTYLCPKKHASTDPDYCSECGIRMAPKPPASAPTTPAEPPAPAQTGAAVDCPACGTPRVAGARFCEVCRYDFATGRPSAPEAGGAPAPSPAPQAVQAVAEPSPLPADLDAVPASTVASRAYPGRNLWAVVVPDRAMATEPCEVPFPETEPARSYPLDLDENLVGRRGARADLHPEIPVHDPSVSARHAKICRRADGSLYVVDVGSSNGTRLNGTSLEPGVEADLSPGDKVAMGMWTSLTVEAR